MLKYTLNKGISAPLAIGIILVLAIIVVTLTLLQYGEILRETPNTPEVQIPEREQSNIEDKKTKSDRILITEKNVLDLFWYQLNFNADCNFNGDPAIEEILYSNKEKGISLKLPYNQNWGNEKYKISPYFVNEKIIGTTFPSGISFGPIFCAPPQGWDRAYYLDFIPQRSIEKAEASIKEIFNSPLDDLQVSKQEVNGIFFIEYAVSVAECPPCNLYFIEVIGEKYNYEFNCTSLYKDCFNAIKTIQFIDN